MAPSCKQCGHEYHTLARPPVSLSCGHSFCRPCLKTIQFESHTLACPTCIKIHSGPLVEDLPTQFEFLTISTQNFDTSVDTNSTGSILVHVKTSSDINIPIKMQMNSKLADLKLRLKVQHGLDAYSAFMSFDGEQLNDQKSFLEYNISSGSIIHVNGAEANEEIVKRLGKGGFGDVYLVKRNGRNLVMKKVSLLDLKDKPRSLALQEMKLLENLNHPNIVSYEGGYQKEDCLYIFMEYCSGGDLLNQIELMKKNESFFKEEQILHWVYKITEGLEYIHHRKIIHRDIKPANIFIATSGTIKIGDFGISRVMGDETTRGSTMIGTAIYVAIEVMNREGFTTKADMFSLGCLAYELAALKTDYPYVRIRLPETVTEEFKSLVTNLLDHNPDNRLYAQEVLMLPVFQNMQSFVKMRTKEEEEYCQDRLQEEFETSRTVQELKKSIEDRITNGSEEFQTAVNLNDDEDEYSSKTTMTLANVEIGDEEEVTIMIENEKVVQAKNEEDEDSQTLTDLRKSYNKKTPPPIPPKPVPRKKRYPAPLPPSSPTPQTAIPQSPAPSVNAPVYPSVPQSPAPSTNAPVYPSVPTTPVPQSPAPSAIYPTVPTTPVPQSPVPKSPAPTPTPLPAVPPSPSHAPIYPAIPDPQSPDPTPYPIIRPPPSRARVRAPPIPPAVPAPSPTRPPAPASSPAPRQMKRGPPLESCVKSISKFCLDYDSGMNPDLKVGLESTVTAMELYAHSKKIQVRGCLALSYINMRNDGRILTPEARSRITSILIKNLRNYPEELELKKACFLNLCQVAKPLDLLLQIHELVPILIKFILVAKELKDSWSCIYVLHLLHVVSSRVGEEYRIIIAHFETMEVIASLIKEGAYYSRFEDIYKATWSVISNLTNETEINCKRFVDRQGLNLVQHCFSTYPPSYHQERGFWITLNNIAEVKTLRSKMIKPLLYYLLKYIEPKSHGNEVSWNSAKIIAHLLSDGQSSWNVDTARGTVIKKLEETMAVWDMDSEPKSSFETLQPIWDLMKVSHTPVCQYWATWTLAKLTRFHSYKYCPMIAADGGLQSLQRLTSNLSVASQGPRPFKKAFFSGPDPSLSMLALAMQIRSTCTDYLSFGIRNRDLLMRLYISSLEGNLDNVKELLNARLDLNCKSTMLGHEGRTALHLAAFGGNISIVCALLDSGAYVDSIDNNGRTPLHTAAWKGHLDILKLLLIYGSDIEMTNRGGWRIIHFAAAGGHVPILEFLSEKCDLGVMTFDRKSALHVAAQYGQNGALRCLLSKGLNPKHQDVEGNNPYQIALKRGHRNIATFLSNFNQ